MKNMEINKHKKQFGEQAAAYTQYRQPYPKELYEFLFSVLPHGSKSILDIGCGTGKSTEPLLDAGLEVFGCDHDLLMIAEAQNQASEKNLNISYCVADVELLPYRDNEFDVVTVGTAFHWFVNEKSINEIKRVLKKGGLLFIFWSLSKKGSQYNDEVPGEIFHKYNWERVPSELRDPDYISNFLVNNAFSDVGINRLPFSYNMTVEQQVGLQKTASSYNLLTKDNRNKFLDEATSLLKAKLGWRDYLTYEDEIHICYGIKA